jgi:hypothetical protein
MRRQIDDFKLGDRAMRYSLFAPRLYNLCLDLGFRPGLMMPSRAFCSDETQGYPIVLLMQHFGVFPFDHGRVGGRVSTDRHGPHSHHGEDLVIVQASHVGFDPASGAWGAYPRLHLQSRSAGDCCGKLCATLSWYQHAYAAAQRQIRFGALDGEKAIFIDNVLLDEARAEGLFPALDRFIDPVRSEVLQRLSTARAFAAPAEWVERLPPETWQEGAQTPIGARLTDDLFRFERKIPVGPEGADPLEADIASAMPTLVTSPRPALDAARYHTQIEFDRVYRGLVDDGGAYAGKKLLFVAGLNVDVASSVEAPFPLTKFVPWAAYLREANGEGRLFEQDELVAALARQPAQNSRQMSFDAAIAAMAGTEAFSLPS